MQDALPRLLAVFARAEFKAPVEAITGLASLLAEDWPEPESRADVDKLRGAAARLDAMVTRLLDPSSSQSFMEGRDASAASGLLRHELRTPITSILGYGELLAEEAGPGHDSQIGILGDINDAARRLLDQIDCHGGLHAGHRT